MVLQSHKVQLKIDIKFILATFTQQTTKAILQDSHNIDSVQVKLANVWLEYYTDRLEHN